MTRAGFTMAALAGVTLTVLAGCGSPSGRISALSPAPTRPVTVQELPPPPATTTTMAATEPTTPTTPTETTPPATTGAPGSQTAETTTPSPSAGAPQGTTTSAPQQVASAAPAAGGTPPTKENVLGQWTISGSGETCQIVVSLTGWEGGHRASTRGCGSPELKNIGAWNVEGSYVVLKDNDGNALARLAQAGDGYQGRLELGGGVSMNR